MAQYLVRWGDVGNFGGGTRGKYIRLEKNFKERRVREDKTRHIYHIGNPRSPTPTTSDHQNMPSTSRGVPSGFPRPLTGNPSGHPSWVYRPTSSDRPTNQDWQRESHFVGPRMFRPSSTTLRMLMPFLPPDSSLMCRLSNYIARLDRMHSMNGPSDPSSPSALDDTSSPPVPFRVNFTPSTSTNLNTSPVSVNFIPTDPSDRENPGLPTPISVTVTPSDSQSAHQGPVIRLRAGNMPDYVTIFPPPCPPNDAPVSLSETSLPTPVHQVHAVGSPYGHPGYRSGISSENTTPVIGSPSTPMHQEHAAGTPVPSRYSSSFSPESPPLVDQEHAAGSSSYIPSRYSSSISPESPPLVDQEHAAGSSSYVPSRYSSAISPESPPLVDQGYPAGTQSDNQNPENPTSIRSSLPGQIICGPDGENMSAYVNVSSEGSVIILYDEDRPESASSVIEVRPEDEDVVEISD